MRAALLAPPCSCSLLPRPPPQPWRPPNLSSRFHVSGATKYRPWDSNAEAFRSEKFNSGFRGTEVEDEEDEDEDEVEDFGVGFRSRGKKKKKRRRWWSGEGSSHSAIDDTAFGIFNEVIDSIWILKVFKSYGWALPPIIVSLLLTTGPKAFLMALGLPLGQSMISLAFDKLWGGTEETRQKRRPRTRKRPFSSAGAGPSKAGRKEEERDEVGKGKMGHQSWVDSNNDYVNKNATRDASNFGGWDDLDRGRSSRKSPGTRGRNPKTAVEEEHGKLSRKGRKSETPLLLRLLIAVFPFLGSWTKIL